MPGRCGPQYEDRFAVVRDAGGFYWPDDGCLHRPGISMTGVSTLRAMRGARLIS